MACIWYHYTFYFSCPFLATFRSGKLPVSYFSIAGSELAVLVFCSVSIAGLLVHISIPDGPGQSTWHCRTVPLPLLPKDAGGPRGAQGGFSGFRAPHLLWPPSPSPVSQVNFECTWDWAKAGLSLSFLSKAPSSDCARDELVLSIILVIF